MGRATIGSMPIFLIEVQIADAGALEFDRVVRMLEVAQSRIGGTATVTRPVIVGLSREDGLLVCLVEAAGLESARRLLMLALLPPGRIRELTLAGPHLLGGRHPGGDVDPGVEAELVEDVVDVGLDRALGQE